MPGGSKYAGPAKSLELYTVLVHAAGVEVKGAKNPYTSRNGHMFSFLDKDGSMALRLSDDAGAEFASAYGGDPVIQYGSVMRGYVAVPDALLRRTEELEPWFNRSYTWIGTLPHKATK